MSVDNLSSQLASTSINDTNEPTIGTGGDKPINASQNEAVIRSAAEGRRLYIGNLAYATTESELKEFFNNYLVESVSIPVNPRTTRPVGYAFVDVSTPSEAERALSELNGQTILDRKVSVQLARKPDESAPAAEGANGDNTQTQRRRSSGRGRGGRRGRGGLRRGGRDGRNGDDEAIADSNSPTNVPGQVEPLTQTTKEALTSDGNVPGNLTAGGEKPKRGPRPLRQRGPPEDGIPSKTKVMVANLPYDIAEEKLLDMFKDYQPTAAKIALRPIPRFMVRKLQERGEPRKGRGFAFVTLASEELQQKAINDLNGKESDGREISVKVAIDSPGKEDDVLGKENGYPSTAEGSANTAATAEAS